jgi:hypothetical protein
VGGLLCKAGPLIKTQRGKLLRDFFRYSHLNHPYRFCSSGYINFYPPFAKSAHGDGCVGNSVGCAGLNEFEWEKLFAFENAYN